MRSAPRSAPRSVWKSMKIQGLLLGLLLGLLYSRYLRCNSLICTLGRSFGHGTQTETALWCHAPANVDNVPYICILFTGYRLCRRPLRLESPRSWCLELHVALDGYLVTWMGNDLGLHFGALGLIWVTAWKGAAEAQRYLTNSSIAQTILPWYLCLEPPLSWMCWAKHYSESLDFCKLPAWVRVSAAAASVGMRRGR